MVPSQFRSGRDRCYGPLAVAGQPSLEAPTGHDAVSAPADAQPQQIRGENPGWDNSVKRRRTRPVRVGNLVIGGGRPVLMQSMTTTTPEDLTGSLAQIQALQRAGCSLVRIAVPSIEAASALGPLRKAMAERGITTSLVADVHFIPRAALEAARHAEKVRINPGNFATDLGDARRRIRPLLDLLEDRGAALRIGVNHGSLAPYVADTLGHGPNGMVGSAMDYLRICRDAGFGQVVVALKASNPAVMVEANRLLVRRMNAEQMDYPIHLGVTEAGEGLEGCLRSAVGIGTLLLEGIGDTIRVSLTGDPVREIEACRSILQAAGAAVAPGPDPGTVPRPVSAAWRGLAVGGSHPPRVEQVVHLNRPREHLIQQMAAAAEDPIHPAESFLCRMTWQPDAAAVAESAATLGKVRQRLGAGGNPIWLDLQLAGTRGQRFRGAGEAPADFDKDDLGPATALLETVDGLCLSIPPGPGFPTERAPRLLEQLARIRPGIHIRWHLEAPSGVPDPSDSQLLDALNPDAWMDAAGKMASRLLHLTHQAGLEWPCFSWRGPGLTGLGRILASHLAAASAGAPRPILMPWMPRDPWAAAVEAGSLLLDGIADALIVECGTDESSKAAEPAQGSPDPAALKVAYALMQASRRRLTRAEFISCPGCGRLAYDLEGTVRRLKASFGHLQGVKIAVMGCAVNGPGEMADADFGYVGSIAGKVDIYAGRQRIHRAILPEAAQQLLIGLLQERGLWSDPPGQ